MAHRLRQDNGLPFVGRVIQLVLVQAVVGRERAFEHLLVLVTHVVFHHHHGLLSLLLFAKSGRVLRYELFLGALEAGHAIGYAVWGRATRSWGVHLK